MSFVLQSCENHDNGKFEPIKPLLYIWYFQKAWESGREIREGSEALLGECGYTATFLETSSLVSQEDGLTGDYMHMYPSKEDAATVIMCIVFLQNAWQLCSLFYIHKNKEPPIFMSLGKYLYGVKFMGCWTFLKEPGGEYPRLGRHMVSIPTTQLLPLWCESSQRWYVNIQPCCVPVLLYL